MVQHAEPLVVIVGDPWLFELALHGGGHARIAIVMLRTQAQTAHRTGHIMDLGQDYVRRRLTSASRFDIIPMVMVRCLRCGTRAYLPDWAKAAAMSKPARINVMRSKYLDGTEALYRFMEQCPGQQSAIDIDEAIMALLGGK